MKKVLLLFIVSFTECFVYAQKNVPDASYHLVQNHNWVQTKNYYLLTLLQNDREVNKLLANDAELAKLTQNKIDALKASLSNCKDVGCFIDNVKFSDAEIKNVSNRLTQLYTNGNALNRLVKTQLIPSGTYILNHNSSPVELLVKAWEQDAAGINYTIDVYAGGKKPNYPQIDSISFNTKDKRYQTLLYDCAASLIGDTKSSRLFFEPALKAALLYLQINERQDPGNYEPMASTVNKAAYDRIKQVNWGKYKYSVILVPGAGTDNLTSPISAEGMLRCRLAAQRFRDGVAPFIMVSGGKVHPYKTQNCEAEEMKKYLLNVLGLPANVVIMEPHARHTTTNMRNCARLMFRYGIPFNKPGVIITDKSQIDGIVMMANRCMKELKYVPYQLGKHVSETELEFYPAIESLQINPYEPLDP